MMRGAIFDMDGVLVDSQPVHMRAWRRFFQSIGKPVAEKEMEFILEGRKREDILHHFLGELTAEQMLSPSRQKELLFREEASTIKTIPGIQSFLEQLVRASIRLAVASCGGSGRVHHLLGYLALRDYFQVVITGDQVREGKPDPTIFHKAAAELKTMPEEVLVVEDSIAGIQAAKAAGMKCLGIARSHRAQVLLEAGAYHVLPDFLSVSVEEFQELFTSRSQ
ncbi:MAG: HAD family phosphatase [Candidatus Acidiferrales bacterium]